MRRILVAALAVLFAFAIAAASRNGTSETVYAGEPRIADWWMRATTQVLRNPGFTIGYSEIRRQPLWVAYRARRPPDRAIGKRPDFTADSRTLFPVSPDDYRDHRYDRGHLAPNYLISKLFGRDAQRATFLMSNVSPQTRRLNQLVWQRLEEAEADAVAPAAGELWVVTGPVFGGDPRELRSGIPIPDAFYRAWLDVTDDGAVRAVAFMVPQDVCGTEPLSRFVVSVDDVEARTGLDLFHALDDAAEARVESSSDWQGWWLEAYDRRAPRYAEHFGSLNCETRE